MHLFMGWVFTAARTLFPSCGEGGYSSLQRAGFPLQWLFLLWSAGSRAWARQVQVWGSRAEAQ